MERPAGRRWSSLIARSLAIAAPVVAGCQPERGGRDRAGEEQVVELDNAEFRDRVVAFVRDVAHEGPTAACTVPLAAEEPFHVAVALYHGGAIVGQGTGVDDQLCVALVEAAAEAVAASGQDAALVAQARFVVELTDRDYAMVEHEGEGLELIRGLVPTRVLDRELVRRRIDEGTAYLLRVIDPELGGVHKYYHAPTDSFEARLHTIYTASALYTLLAVHAHDQDDSLLPPIARAAEFLLAMQRVAPDQPGHGAFHYSLLLDGQQREPRFVVGTTSKSIFTLIELHALTGDEAYLDAARLAADWLLTMQRADGRVWSELRRAPDDTWTVVERESMLYTGQVLSALSRLYEATADDRYLAGAARTASRLIATVEGEGCYLGDDYRAPNPISSSWVILSQFDFARASADPSIGEVAFDCADELLTRQIDAPDDAYRHGRWQASLSSSGNGWLAEVLSVLSLDCPQGDPDGCARYHDAVVLLLRLLMQYTYAPENSFMIKDPAMARGGLFWNTSERYVRTDSVCHAVNAYVFTLDRLADGVLVELAEPPLAERLGLAGGVDEDDEAEGESEEDDDFAGPTVSRVYPRTRQ